eukprot:2836524-Amphidinium_carterae.1
MSGKDLMPLSWQVHAKNWPLGRRRCRGGEARNPSWSPRWKVLRSTDSFPGCNAAQPFRDATNEMIAACKTYCEENALGGFVSAG